MTPRLAHHLRAAGTSVLLVVDDDGVASVAHWGPDLGELTDEDVAALVGSAVPAVPPSAVDVPVRPGLLPSGASGFLGRPALLGSRAGGGAWSPDLRATSVERDGDSVTLSWADDAAGLHVTTEVVLEPAGVLRVRHTLRNDDADAYRLEALDVVLPLPDRVDELLDLTGRWCRERQPLRRPVVAGTLVHEGREGRPGHDFPLAFTALAGGTTNRQGEAWAVSLAWSGNHRHALERLTDGTTRVSAGELLLPGEIELAPGGTYATPWLVCAYSDRGLDGVSERYHRYLRARPHHPSRPRPLTLNTWEAVYFDHDLTRLTTLADTAAKLGVERFVLDDGWFLGRRDDTRGLGDWLVDPEVWPQGLHPLVDHVRGLGMEFGLWVEPEMVNPDSELLREHPDWLLHVEGRTPPAWRHQQVLDLARPEAFELVLARLDALLSEYAIAYLKWDHNRALIEAGHLGRAGVHVQTLAVYALLDQLRARHPGVEIESCSSGGARVDLGILERTDRVWASDTNDALERQHLQRWTQLVLPPELVGAHVGPPHAHTTGRRQDLSFRLATALFGHAGIEWDVAAAAGGDRWGLQQWIALYRDLRPLLHTGTVVHGDHPDPAALVHGVVAEDAADAVFAYVQLAASAATRPALVRLPGLAPERRYRLTSPAPAGPPWAMQRTAPAWLAAGETVLPGRVLESVGVVVPILGPEQALLLRATEVD